MHPISGSLPVTTPVNATSHVAPVAPSVPLQDLRNIPKEASNGTAQKPDAQQLAAYSETVNTPENVARWVGTAIAQLKDPDLLRLIGATADSKPSRIGQQWQAWRSTSSPFATTLQDEFYRQERILTGEDEDDGLGLLATPVLIQMLKEQAIPPETRYRSGN